MSPLLGDMERFADTDIHYFTDADTQGCGVVS
jgi:hypothetical protein